MCDFGFNPISDFGTTVLSPFEDNKSANVGSIAPGRIAGRMKPTHPRPLSKLREG